MPKAELHVHLEGSIQPATLLQLARQNGQPLPAADEAGLRAYYQFRDFSHFLDLYITILKCLRTPDDYRLIAYEFGREAARQNIRYSRGDVHDHLEREVLGLALAGDSRCPE